MAQTGHEQAAHGSHAAEPAGAAGSLNRIAFSATVHCLTGCAIGEVLGVMIGTALGWGNWETIVLAIALAYALTMLPLVRAGLALTAALPLAFASDTVSIAVMEFVDNVVLLLIPGAMEAGLDDALFWASLAFALVLAGIAAYPVNLYLIS
ncbi:MAG TPA: DUF4396 domain-containing protein, partial [Gaiellaceae bacterium]|nr:DUF4396 domain-containing protein [Gaiellaceae bacterium]